ncbi:hypothetical protein HT576_13125 [Haloterrigena sp. SYSU A121-1]|uniref:Uncharacterized protein n=1 Tax=Haloterrigena gelatinilytica TaxID=2741724 RepID=A0A8J8GLN3_9EURY|nr:DUF6498-containing protein [Haloterrigena gelatinilytica]NUB91956.1 hypothetical protein [Haloterrigena gelatinilytica]
MVSPQTLERSPSRLGFAPILVANLLPLAGVLAFGWDAATLVTVYALEVVLAFPLTAAKALFARQPPKIDDDGDPSVSDELKQRRGSAELVSWLPPVYPRNVPFVGTVFTWFAGISMVVAMAISAAIPVADVLWRSEVVLSIVALVAATAADAWRDYFRGGRYETVSAYEVVQAHLGQMFLLALVLMAVASPEAIGGVALLAGFVFVKVLVEWASFRAAHGEPGRLTGWLAGPDDPTEPADPPAVPDGDPDVRISTDDTAVLYTAVHQTLFKAVFFAQWILSSLVVVLSIVAGDDTPLSLTVGTGVAFALLLLVIPAAEFVETVLRYGPLEYRRYGDRLVAYDTWVDEPQWSVPLHEIRDAAVVVDHLPDHLLGTRTFDVTMGWGDDEFERDLGPVADPDAFVSAFELRLRTADLDPIDRRLAGAAVVLGVGFAGALILWYKPWLSVISLVPVAFLLPFSLAVPWGLWRLAYPSPE